MDAPRFYCEELSTGLVTLDEAESRHALRSLRLRAGENVVLFDGAGRVAHATIAEPSTEASAKRSRAVVRVERVLLVPEPRRTLKLIVAGCKGDRLDWLIEKCTELGVTHIELALFERSIVRVGAQHVEKQRQRSIQACKQCRRAWLPTITSGTKLLDTLDNAEPTTLLIADPDRDAPALASWLHTQAPAAEHLTAVIGPEGGLTDTELTALDTAGGHRVRLADTILRVETAAICFASNWAAR